MTVDAPGGREGGFRLEMKCNAQDGTFPQKVGGLALRLAYIYTSTTVTCCMRPHVLETCLVWAVPHERTQFKVKSFVNCCPGILRSNNTAESCILRTWLLYQTWAALSRSEGEATRAIKNAPLLAR